MKHARATRHPRYRFRPAPRWRPPSSSWDWEPGSLRLYQLPIVVPSGDHDGLRMSPVPLSSVRTVPSCQRTRSLRTGLVLLLPPVTEPHTIMLFGPHEACVASVPCSE